MPKFSDRIGVTEPRGAFQIHSMDDRLRNGMYNLIYNNVTSYIPYFFSETPPFWRRMVQIIWDEYYGLPLDEIGSTSAKRQMKDHFMDMEWYDVYNVVDRVGTMLDLLGREEGDEFRSEANRVLQREGSGYRFVGSELAPIVEEAEIEEVEAAISTSSSLGLAGMRSHIQEALAKLSDKKNPDYRNSIKESVSAVESVARAIVSDPSATLGQALKVIEDQVGLHPALKKGFSNIYGYTSDEGGIRHALTEEDRSTFEDAKYMLVSCSAFCNYLVAKAERAGARLDAA